LGLIFLAKTSKISMSFEVEIEALTAKETKIDFETKGISAQQIIPLLFKLSQ
jgi:hypothetical protein